MSILENTTSGMTACLNITNYSETFPKIYEQEGKGQLEILGNEFVIRLDPQQDL